MKKQNLWNHSDSKDAKIIALTTKVETLQKSFASSMSDGGNSGDRRNDFHYPRDGWKKTIPAWKRTKKEDSIKVDGRTYWWCVHHKYTGRYDGLYRDHKSEDHDNWKVNKGTRGKGRKETMMNRAMAVLTKRN